MLKKKNELKRLNNQGFTLIELMVVIVILGILAGLVVPRIMDRPEQARKEKARVDITTLETALDLYKLDHREYPATLDSLVDDSKRTGGYLKKKKLPKDPWGNDFEYTRSGNEVILRVTAPDGTVISNLDEGESGGGESAEGQVSWGN